jgi:hypothetical protein
MRHREAQRLGGPEIDDHLEFRDLLARQILGLLSLENPTCLDACWTVRFCNATSVTYVTISGCEIRRLVRSRYCMAKRERGKLVAAREVKAPF